MDGILLHVTYACLPGKAEEFYRALKKAGVPELVRAADGCLQYDYVLSMEQPDTLLLIEHWRDAAALRVHQDDPVMQRILACKHGRVLRTSQARFE